MATAYQQKIFIVEHATILDHANKRAIIQVLDAGGLMSHAVPAVRRVSINLDKLTSDVIAHIYQIVKHRRDSLNQLVR